MTDQATLAANTLSGRYTELPKIDELLGLGVRPELIPTFYALADYANNKTGECYPMMKTLAAKLGRSARTVQSHLHELQDFGLIEFVERLRDGCGRYRGYVYRLMHTAIIAERRKRKREEQKERERQRALEKAEKKRKRLFSKKSSTGNGLPVREDMGTTTGNDYPPNPPTGSFKEGYEWLFGEKPDPEKEKQRRQEQQRKREEESRRRREGYEWFFE